MSSKQSKHIQQYNLILDDNYAVVIYLRVRDTGDIQSTSRFAFKDKAKKAEWCATSNSFEKRNKKHEYYLRDIDTIKLRSAKWKLDNPEKVAINSTRYNTKRYMWGKPIPINNWFIGSRMHHLHIGDDHQTCIFIPADLHIHNWHSNKNDKSMEKINLMAYVWWENEPENRLQDYDDVYYEMYKEDMLTEEEHQ